MELLQQADSPEGLRQLIDKYGGVTQCARALDVSRGKIFHRARKWGITIEDRKGSVVYQDRKIPNPEPDEFYDALESFIQAQEDMESVQTEITIAVEDNKPIGFANWGDWHLGAKGTDHAQFRRDIEIFTNTDGLYYGGTGDYKNNVIEFRPKGSGFDEVARPGMQDIMALDAAHKTSKAALYFVRGCHDDFDKQTSDRDFVAEMAQRAECANLWHGGLVHLRVGDITYDIRTRHKYKRESGLNTTNTQRAQVETDGPADMIVRAHLHYPDMQHTTKMGREMVYLRAGTYKYRDEFGQKIGGYTGEYGIPMVILYPDRKHMIPFRNFEDGLKALARERA